MYKMAHLPLYLVHLFLPDFNRTQQKMPPPLTMDIAESPKETLGKQKQEDIVNCSLRIFNAVFNALLAQGRPTSLSWRAPSLPNCTVADMIGNHLQVMFQLMVLVYGASTSIANVYIGQNKNHVLKFFPIR